MANDKVHLENQISLIESERQGERILANDIQVKERVLAAEKEKVTRGMENLIREQTAMAA